MIRPGEVWGALWAGVWRASRSIAIPRGVQNHCWKNIRKLCQKTYETERNSSTKHIQTALNMCCWKRRTSFMKQHVFAKGLTPRIPRKASTCGVLPGRYATSKIIKTNEKLDSNLEQIHVHKILNRCWEKVCANDEQLCQNGSLNASPLEEPACIAAWVLPLPGTKPCCFGWFSPYGLAYLPTNKYGCVTRTHTNTAKRYPRINP